MAWIIGYLLVGLVTVAFAAWNNSRAGDAIDADRCVVFWLAWPVFVAIVIGEMIAARLPLKDQAHD